MKSETPIPISNEAAHRAALKEIDRLWGSPKGSPEGDRLDILMAFADSYERARWPDDDLDSVKSPRSP